MGCCASKPCMRKLCCGGCCNRSNNSRRDDNGVANATRGVRSEGPASIEMDKLAEEDEDEDSVHEEVRFGVILPEQLPLTVRPPPPRNNHNNNANNSTNNDRSGGTDTRSTANNKSRVPAHTNESLQATASSLSQYQFFKLLDDKIESGPDYDANCERERKLELERLSTLMRHWETCSRTSSQPGTPVKRSALGPQAIQPVTVKQLSTALAQVTQVSKAIKQHQPQQQLQGRGMVIPHPNNRVQQQQQQLLQSQQHLTAAQQQMTPTIVTGNPAGRYWPPMEMVINNYDGMYEFEAPIQNQRVSPTVNQTATIIHQTYGVIGSNAPIPALLRTGHAGNVPPPAMTNQLFQFGPRNSDAVSIAESNFAREYHQEMYTGSHSAGSSINAGAPRQHFDVFNQNAIVPRPRSATIVIQQPQPQLNTGANYDTYTYRPIPDVCSSGNVAPAVSQLSASAQLKFSTLVSQGTPQQIQQIQYPSVQFHGNGDISHHDKSLSKKGVLPKEAQGKRPPKERLKHQLVSGEVHHQIQENPQRQLPSNGPVVMAGPSGSTQRHLPSNVPIVATEPSASITGRSGSGLRQLPSNGSIIVSGSGSDNMHSYQTTVHISMNVAGPALNKSQNKRRKEHNIDMKKLK